MPVNRKRENPDVLERMDYHRAISRDARGLPDANKAGRIIDMTYCFEFVEKFRKDGNFCGLSRDQAATVELWSRLLSELAECGCDEKRVVKIITCSAYKHGRIHLLDRNTPLWRSFIQWVVSRTARLKPITGSELREYIGLEKMTDKELMYHLTPKGYSKYKKGKSMRER